MNKKDRETIKSFTKFLYSLSATELTALGAIIGIMMGQALTTNEQGTLGNFFELVGQTLLTMNTQNIFIEGINSNNNQ